MVSPLTTPADALSSTPASKKGGVFSSGNSSRRQSLSNVSASSSIPQGIGYSPGSISNYQIDAPSPAGSGIPSFRTLRSLLPFGSNKNSSPSNTASPNTSRSPFANFGSVRRSVNKDRERKNSLSNEATPVITIGPGQLDNVRRSVSLSRLEKPLPSEPDFDLELSHSFHGERLSASESRIPRRIPSPSPLGDLSIIVEADNSGVSKHLPLIGIEVDSAESEASMKPHAHSTLTREASKGIRKNSVALEFTTDSLAEEVRQALRNSTSSTQSTSKWMEGAFEPVVIDGDEHPDLADASFDGVNLTSLIPLSSNTRGSKGSHSPPYSPRDEKNSPTPSPSTPTFPSSPASTSRLPRSHHGPSFLPRLRSSQSPSPTTSTHFVPTPSPTRTSVSVDTPRRASTIRPPVIALNGGDFSMTSPRSPSSPGLSPASTSTPAKRKATHARTTTLTAPPSTSASGSRTPGLTRGDAKSASNAINSSGLVSRTLRQVILGNNSRLNDRSALESFVDSSSLGMVSTPTRNSLDSRRAHHTALSRSDIGLGRPSLELRRGNSFDSRIRPDEKGGSTPSSHQQIFQRTAANADSMSEAPRSREHETLYRASLDMTRLSYDPSNRPGNVARVREREQDRQRTSSLRLTDAAGEHAPPPRETMYAARQRKRSMSVQERPPKGTPSSEIASAAIARPGSSASVYGARGGRKSDRELESGSGSGHERSVTGSEGAVGPRMEWLGPRTAKAFRAAGLLDFEREEGHDSKSAELFTALRYGNGSIGGASPSPTATALSGSSLLAKNRLLSGRSASEYNPVTSKSHSRMAFSEMGVSSHGRRGSGTFSAYGGSASAHGGGSQYGHTGLMESPTFTVSSSSRERDTPKSSTSTAPTSLSESGGYLGRDRMEKERERDEVRELKERHATEMGALLNALSDTQRTVRMLREENSQLRDRLDKLALIERENDDLRHACEVLEREVIRLRSDNGDLQHELSASRSLRAPGGLTQSWSQSSSSTASFKTPVAKQGKRSPLAIDTTPQFLQGDDDHDEDEEVYNNTMIIHDDEDAHEDAHEREHEHGPVYRDSRADSHPFYSDTTHKSLSATPSVKRRLSSSSSIFPVLPANMTMLLHDDGAGVNGEFNRNVVDISLQSNGFIDNGIRFLPSSQARSASGTSPISYANLSKFGHHADNSITSTISISPTTANFSMTTGSPRSLVLRPEHEILLGDMESLDLGVRDTDADSTTSAIDRVASRNGW